MSAYHDTHPLIAARVTQHDYDAIQKALGLHGQEFRDWVVAMAQRCLQERLPESQGGLKINVDGVTVVVDFEAVLALLESSEREAEHWEKFSKSFVDKAVRATYLRQAGRYHDAALWLQRIVDAGRRRHQVLDDGIRAPRHRFKAGVPPQFTASMASSGKAR